MSAAGSLAGELETANRRLSLRGVLPALAFVGLIALALGARLLTYDRYLPWFDFGDESIMFLLTRHFHGFGEAPIISDWLVGYPPGYLWINMGIQRATEALWPQPWIVPSDYIQVLRLAAVTAGVLTTMLIACIGWELAGPVAGWLGGMVWALSPFVLEHNNVAIADPFVYLFVAMAVATSLRAWITKRPYWLLISTLVIIVAIYTKYTPVYTFIPWAFATVALLRHDFRRTLSWVIVMLVMGAIAAGWLVFVYGAFSLSNSEAEAIRGRGLELIFDVHRNLVNLYHIIAPVGIGVFIIGLIAGIIAYVYSRRRGWRVVDWRWVVILLLVAIGGMALGAGFRTAAFNGFRLRHSLPQTMMLAMIWGMAVAQTIWTLSHWRRSVAHGFLIAVVAIAAIPMLLQIENLHRLFQREDIRVVLWRWMDDSVPLEGLVLTHAEGQLEKTWNRPWSGYDGSKAWDWRYVTQEDIMTIPAQEFLDANMLYFTITDHDREQYFDLPEAGNVIDGFTLVKTIPANDNLVGASTVYFYRLIPPDFSADAVFGEQIQLAGYDLNATEFAPGAEIIFRPYWRILRQPDTNYSMFAHMVPAAGDELVTQFDTAPAPVRLTLTWTDTDELYFGSQVILIPPDDVPAGEYRLLIGLYDFTNGQRLTLADGSDHYAIPIEITE